MIRHVIGSPDVAKLETVSKTSTAASTQNLVTRAEDTCAPSAP